MDTGVRLVISKCLKCTGVQFNMTDFLSQTVKTYNSPQKPEILTALRVTIMLSNLTSASGASLNSCYNDRIRECQVWRPNTTWLQVFWCLIKPGWYMYVFPQTHVYSTLSWMAAIWFLLDLVLAKTLSHWAQGQTRFWVPPERSTSSISTVPKGGPKWDIDNCLVLPRNKFGMIWLLEYLPCSHCVKDCPNELPW